MVKTFKQMTKDELVEQCKAYCGIIHDTIEREAAACQTIDEIELLVLQNKVEEADELRIKYLKNYDSKFNSDRCVLRMFNEIAFGKILNARVNKKQGEETV